MIRRMILAMCIIVMLCSIAHAAAPKIWYSMDENGNVYRDNKKVNVNVNSVEGSVFEWVEGDSAVWIFNPYNLEHAPVYIPLRKGEHCKQLMQSRDGSVYIMELSSENIAAYDMTGELVIRTPGFFPAYWVDNYRFVYTSCVPGRRRGAGKNAHTWRGVSVFEIFPEENDGNPAVLVTPVIEADRNNDYVADGIDDDGGCIVIEVSGKSSRQIKVSLPAAG